ncbi:ECF RNA polymerase sigma factor SigR [Abditibacteriota bacterium]|nr:ECF RNA polymerase sigma factor SigR [Abditibacteriota bacterium]
METNPPSPPESGSIGDFSVLLEPILASALKTATFLTRNSEDAEDLVQEAALQAFRSFDQFEQGTNFKAWFLKVQHNCFLGRLRRDARRPQTVAIEDEETVENLYLYEQTRGIGMHKGGGDPAGKLLDRLDSEQIALALRALPDEFRVVATLYFVEELTYEQIAQVVDRPLNTVRSRLHRSRRLLQKSLWQMARERGIVSGNADE